MRHVLARGEVALHLDSDMRVYAPLEGLTELLGRHAVVLTPHLLGELPDDGREPDELSILLAGAFNTGVIGARPGRDGGADGMVVRSPTHRIAA